MDSRFQNYLATIAETSTKVHHTYPDSQNVSLYYTTKRYPDGGAVGFKVSLKELKKVERNPYPLLLKKIDEANLDGLNNIYVSFVGIVHYKPDSWEDRLQDSLMRCFYLHEDTASLNKIVKKRFGKMNYHFLTQVIHQKGIDEVFDKKSVSAQKGSSTLTEKLDSLHAYFQKLSKDEDKIYIAKPILDDINTIIQDEISVIVLGINATPSVVIKQMLLSLIGSVLLLVLLASCIGYMFYTILKQKKLSEIKDDFIGNVSHELKTPVSITLAAIHGMQHFDVLKNKAKTDIYLDTADKEMQRLSAMIDNILNSSIYEQSDFNLHIVKFNLREMLTEMANTQELHSKKIVSIKLNYQAKEEVFADKAHTYNVFINLLDNAIKYGGEEVQINIECMESTMGLKIQISDNGKGIPATYQKNIFDKFFRVPSPNDHSIKGHGLGLSYVKNIVKKHKGKITLIKSDDNGTTFEIHLPQ
ncbi:sensor histidine kinase [Pedobacter frigoris]|uniref:histidine kinase n=1 Tax=Pedobacter frigoris TaxID=2571272 RepID=A0A4U1CSH9_9SPHI|nr:HAMP domain-containing sensor histidine kinase [Pedobacter frigoris]TKC08889.1 HAMP domain-containing histidine kinase [Pedobacter frigoris]